MKKIYFTVGPSQLFPTVRNHIKEAVENDIPSISHRGDQFAKIFHGSIYTLKKLFSIPSDYHIFFLSSGTEAMERIIQNCVEKTSFHFVNGGFGKRFFEIALELRKHATKLEVADGEGFDVLNIEIPKTAEMICITQNETSTGFAFPLKDIYQIKTRYPSALIALDVVSSIPHIDLDYTKVDCVFFSVQKGFGLPAGLGVLVLSPAVFEKALYVEKKTHNVGSYHNFKTLFEYAKKGQTPETPNILNMYLFEKVLHDMQRVGIKRVRQQTEEKARIIYKFLEHHEKYSPFIRDEKYRSNTTIVVQVRGGSKQTLEALRQKGCIVGAGYGNYKDEHIRIANFPAHTVCDAKYLLRCLERAEESL